jgi:hypothetical protein
MVGERQADLLELILALAASRRLARRLYRRQQECDEHSNDGNDDQ